MNAATLKRINWFWPWQDEKEEAWLESMSEQGWHLKSVQILGQYTFQNGEPRSFAYRLDFQIVKKSDLPGYLQVFQDAGWEYLGEISNWRYWRKEVEQGESLEIFTDVESRLRKYQRLLGFMGFMLFLLLMLGQNMFRRQVWSDPDNSVLISAIYLCGTLAYAVLIPVYIVVVVKLWRRIQELKKKHL